MLKIMKRGSSVKKLKELLEMMRNKFSFVRTSVIIGHPGEEEEDFEELKSFLKEYKFDRVNIFAYSDEEGTTAYLRKDKVDSETIERRVKEIEKIVNKTTKERLKLYLNREIECFLDGITEDNLFYSVRPKLWTPEVDGDILINENEAEKLEIGNLYKVVPTQLAKNQLIGKILN